LGNRAAIVSKPLDTKFGQPLRCLSDTRSQVGLGLHQDTY
jgi:hypothetical protein